MMCPTLKGLYTKDRSMTIVFFSRLLACISQYQYTSEHDWIELIKKEAVAILTNEFDFILRVLGF
jgi:NAD-dependent SIR2 family protein deacetylase